MRCIICESEARDETALYLHYFSHSIRELAVWLLVYQVHQDVFERGNAGGFGEVIQAMTTRPDDTEPVVEVRLDECWRCNTPIPNDDEVGLCEKCKTELQNA